MSPDRRSPARRQPPREAEQVLGPADASVLDIVDNVLSKGVMLTGDVSLGLAQVELIYARVSLLLCAADRIFPGEDSDVITRHTDRRARQRSGAPGARRVRAGVERSARRRA